MPAVSAQLNNFIGGSEVAASPGRTARSPRDGWFQRALKALQEARLKQAEREVARFIEVRGGRITDTLEREIEHHFV